MEGNEKMNKETKKKSNVGNKSIIKLAARIKELQLKAEELGLFFNDRELLECKKCGLIEDVAVEGRPITYNRHDIVADSGLRFEPCGKNKYLCPVCGSKVSEKIERRAQNKK